MQGFKRFLTSIIVFLGIFICTLGWAQEIKPIRVGWFLVDGFMYYHPEKASPGANGKDEPGVFSGYNYEYLKTIARYTGWHYQFVVCSMDEAFRRLEKGDLDLMCGINKTPDREKRFLFPDIEMGSSGLNLVTKVEDQRYAFGDFKNFNGIRIGIVQPSYQNLRLAHLQNLYHFTASVSGYPSFAATDKALLEGKVDAILANTLSTSKHYKVLASIPTDKFYVITNKHSQALLEAVNKAILQIKYLEPDFDQVLTDKYFYSQNVTNISFTKDEQKWLAERRASGKPVTVLFDPAWLPIEYKDPQTGAIKGIMAEIFQQLQQKTGLQFKFVTAATYGEALKALKQDAEVAASISTDLDWADQHDSFVTQPIFDMPILVVFAPGSEKDKVVALPQDYHLTKAVRQRLEQETENKPAAGTGKYQYQYYGTMGECVDAVRAGRAGRTYINTYELNYYINAGKLTNLSVQSVAGFSEPIGIGVSKQADPLLFTIIAKALKSIPPNAVRDMVISNTNTQYDPGFLDYVYRHPLVSSLGAAILALLVGGMGFFYYSSKRNERLRLKLEAANNAKTDFVNRMSHDIRTPMNAIIGLTELARQDNQSQGMEDYLDKISYSSRYLLALINDILDLSKLDSKTFTLHPEPYRVQDFLYVLSSTIGAQAKEKGVNFVSNLMDHGHRPIKVDSLRFNQIFMNLLSNAVKYTPEGGTVRFLDELQDVGADRVRITFKVQDTGIGIGPEFLAHIFEPFTQEDEKHVATNQGSGLGLAIVKRIVDSMGGTISVTSAKGEGSTFTVVLEVPYATEAELAAQAADRQRELDLTAARVKQDLQGKRILVAEDNQINQLVVKKMLENFGAVCELAGDGQVCLDKFTASAEHYYDAILMDVRMPVLDGLSATRKIRALERTDAKLPIVALTADAYEDARGKVLAAGMDAYLSKPVYAKDMYRVLAAALPKGKQA
jgi:signal transduction histidine kinase/CheY-like chemotaxis protein